MSLYGNIKKINESNFQFDRIYSTRKEMDTYANSDKVMVGRYVLVEYGERFSVVPKTGESIISESNNFKLVNTENGNVIIENVEESSDFRNHANTDLSTYGAVYDSTVWQKIYLANAPIGSQEKYIMVAELNAIVPKIDMMIEKPLIYKKLENDITNSHNNLYAKVLDNNDVFHLVRLKNTTENYNKPYFGTDLDTELSYMLHQPSIINLKIDNDEIEYNKNGFNPVYSFGEKEGPSAVAWVPEGIDCTIIDETEGLDQLATLNSNEQKIDTKALFMSFPALGNTMNALYDLLYGKPLVLDENELDKGILRPYFEQYRPDNETRTIKGIAVVAADENDNFVPVLINNEQLYIQGKPNENIEITIQGYNTYPEIFPNTLILKEYNIESNGYTQVTEETYDSNKLYYLGYNNNHDILYMQIPDMAGIYDDLSWLENVPALSDILSNNTIGLVALLKSLFGYSDPLTGKTNFYLLNDWLSSDDINTSGPFIANKPKVVGGYPTTYTQKIQIDNRGNSLYNYTETTIDDNNFSGGHYQIDYDTWRLLEYSKIITIITSTSIDNSKLNAISEYIIKNTNDNILTFNNNQQNINIEQNNNRVLITGDLNLINGIYKDQNAIEAKRWICLDLLTNINDIKDLKINNKTLTDDEIRIYKQWLDPRHILIWLDLDELNKKSTSIIFSAQNYDSTKIVFSFRNESISTE